MIVTEQRTEPYYTAYTIYRDGIPVSLVHISKENGHATIYRPDLNNSGLMSPSGRWSNGLAALTHEQEQADFPTSPNGRCLGCDAPNVEHGFCESCAASNRRITNGLNNMLQAAGFQDRRTPDESKYT